MRCAVVLLLGCLACGLLPAQKLLLTPQRLRRLQRDRERATARWVNFDNRVESAAESPERGFELALYYAVTQDPKRGREALEWAVAHPCERRQTALVLDWAGPLASSNQRKALTDASCPAEPTNSATSVRDTLFLKIAAGEDPEPLIDKSQKELLASLENGGFQNSTELYAACEYLTAARSAEHVDLRENAAQFFINLPAELLLSLKPPNVEQPQAMMHLAALALVALDPNLPDSQFLQAWAMEGPQTIQDGPGVAYEFLWADPYLPGIGYQDLDPWIYDPSGRLFARKNWDSNSCWISIAADGVDQQNCPPDWRNVTNTFGHLTLIPVIGGCATVPHFNPSETAIVWQLRPREKLVYIENREKVEVQADPAGLLRLDRNVEGKICRSR